MGGIGGEVVSSVSELAFNSLKGAPKRLGLSDCPIPTSPALSKLCYPRANHIVQAVSEMLEIPRSRIKLTDEMTSVPLDVPNPTFTGPF